MCNLRSSFKTEFPFSVFALPKIYTRPPLISRSSRVFSAGCFHGPWNAPVLSLRRLPKRETDPLSTCASDPFPAPASLPAEFCSGLRLAYPAGKGTEAIRRAPSITEPHHGPAVSLQVGHDKPHIDADEHPKVRKWSSKWKCGVIRRFGSTELARADGGRPN
jgi:hypothetical protein